MSNWLSFYNQIKGEDWSECTDEEDFVNLPQWIQDECIKYYA